MVLGLAIEAGKLSLAETLDVIGWAAENAAGLPLSVTVATNGAALAILQPPS